jgi:multidrug efflux system outer membrane protein
MKKKFALMLIASLTACEGIPPPSSDPQLTFAPPDKWSGAKTKQGEILKQWWRSFDDEKLPALIQEALLHNHDLAAAAARVEIAAIQAKIAGASSWPRHRLHPPAPELHRPAHPIRRRRCHQQDLLATWSLVDLELGDRSLGSSSRQPERRGSQRPSIHRGPG